MIRILLCTGLLAAGSLYAQEIELQVELVSPLGTATARRGDPVSATVVSPASLRGDTIDGKVTESKSGAKLGGQSVLTINFDTLKHGGAAIPINTQLKSATNSKGRVNVDEEGRALKRGTGNVAKAGAGAGVGGLVGRIAGGGKGAAIGAAAGGLAAVVLIDLAADAPNITFSPGSRMTLSARARDNQSLASLPPGAGTPAPPPAQQPAPAPSPAVAAVAPAPAPVAAAEPVPPAGSPQPELTAVKAEFIPGEKVILFDDFTDMAGDEPPPHWKVRGGTAELRKGEGVRQLTFTARRTDLTPNLTELPKNFTMEVDMRIVGHDDAIEWRFVNRGGGGAPLRLRFASVYTKLSIFCAAGNETISSQQIPMDWTKPIKTALWLQNGRMRLYVNGDRIFDVNQIQLPDLGAPTASLTVYSDPKSEKYIGVHFARFAESMPDFSQVILSGRYVSHGILFDTDSDRLKAESAPVIKMIARGLETNINLKLQIEGHTDSVGNAAHNLELSRRRAEAVKTVLVEQFKIDAARLTTGGLGAGKPIESNDTPQGRAQNRRVEFVRQL